MASVPLRRKPFIIPCGEQTKPRNGTEAIHYSMWGAKPRNGTEAIYYSVRRTQRRTGTEAIHYSVFRIPCSVFHVAYPHSRSSLIRQRTLLFALRQDPLRMYSQEYFQLQRNQSHQQKNRPE